MGRIIEDVEAKYGLRPPRPAEPGDGGSPEELVDTETVREIESYYDRKQERDDRRKGRSSTTTPPQ